MSEPSLTSSESFRFRIQRSDVARSLLMAGVYAFMIVITIVRRVAGGVVMSDDRVFWPYMTALAVALSYETFAALSLRAMLRRNRLVATWKLSAGAVFELAVPALLLIIAHLWSPRGQYAALASPPLLLLPMTVLLSILRLRPRTTLLLGIGAAMIHATLTMDTIQAEQLDSSQYPVLFSYAAMLALTGVAGMLVSAAARRYVAEAVAEAQARERTGLKLASVERDLEVARQIQVGLLPNRPPVFDGFDIAGMNTPADQTGGDYFDWQQLPNGRLLVVMADVTGHGIGPALVMAVCRAYARASAPLDMEPVSLMRRLNELLHGDLRDGRFITLAMAVLDKTGAVELVSAGHGPTLLFRPCDRSIEMFGGDGLPLAVATDQDYAPSRGFDMEPGDVLIMLTDGVFEWQNVRGEQFGAQRLRQALLDAASEPATRIVECLHRAVLDFASGSPQNDDVTIVAIKRCA